MIGKEPIKVCYWDGFYQAGLMDRESAFDKGMKLNGLWLSEMSVDALKKELGVSTKMITISDEDAEIVKLENDLDDAMKDGILFGWGRRATVGFRTRYSVTFTSSSSTHYFERDEIIDSARDAVAFCNERWVKLDRLEEAAKNPKLTPVEEMSDFDKLKEICARGWVISKYCDGCVGKNEKYPNNKFVFTGCGYDISSMLINARRLDEGATF